MQELLATPRPLLVVDIQPAYRHAMAPVLLRQLFARLDAQPDDLPIVAFHVNEELSGDTLSDVQEFWRECGAGLDLIERVRWAEKSYAFLRGWMDIGIPDAEIVTTVRALRDRRFSDSRCFEQEELEVLSQAGAESANPLFRCFDTEHCLDTLQGAWHVCGGGRDECLKEVELMLQAYGIEHDRLDHLTY